MPKRTRDLKIQAMRPQTDTHAVVELGLDGTILAASDTFLQVVGYARAEVVGRNHSILLSSEDAASPAYEGFWQTLRDGRVVVGEHRRRNKNGGIVWLYSTYVPIAGPDGRPSKIVKHAVDITASKMEAADHAGQVAAIGRSQAIIEFDLTGVVLGANDNFLNAFGYEAAEVVGRHHSMFVDDATRGSAEYEAFWAALRGGEFTRGEYRRIGKDGRQVWIHATYNPIFGLDGKPFKVVKYASDVTVAKIAASNFQGQIEAIQKSQAVVEFDLSGNILYANPNFLAVVGYDLDEIVGQHHRKLVFADEFGRQDYEAFWGALRSGEFRSGEYRRRNRRGEEVWLQASYNPIRDLDGNPFKVVKFATDMTESVRRKLREGELETARLAAEASARAKSEFLANMSHELRTPLTSILGFSRLIGRDGTLSPNDYEYLDLIRDAGETLLRVVNDILDFSKLEDGSVTLTNEPFSLRTLITGVERLLGGQADDKGLSIVLSSDDVVLQGDSARLRQIIINLVGNAIKFTDRGSVNVEATFVSAGSENGVLEVRVTDTGPGIPADRLDHLFQRFSQADQGLDRRHTGTGLGLAICRLLVEAMGGEVGVNSEFGTGSQFWFRAPLTMGAEEAVREIETENTVERSLRILMADDHFANRKLVQSLLSPFDVELVFAEDGLEATQLAAQSGFDLILMDMQMPNMDGLTATREIRRLDGPNSRTPILALTANILPQHQQECLAAGMNGHLAKPIDVNALVEAINQHALDRGRPPQSAAA